MDYIKATTNIDPAGMADEQLYRALAQFSIVRTRVEKKQEELIAELEERGEIPHDYDLLF